MIEVMMIAALIWPAECLKFGELYRDAAVIRDNGMFSRKEVMAMSPNKRIRLALLHVYDRRDMNPDHWYWFATGVCIGQKDKHEKGVEWRTGN